MRQTISRGKKLVCWSAQASPMAFLGPGFLFHSTHSTPLSAQGVTPGITRGIPSSSGLGNIRVRP